MQDETGQDVDPEGRGETGTDARPAPSKPRRPKKSVTSGKTRPRSLHLPDDLHDLLWLHARKKKTTVSAVATQILRSNLPKLRIESD
jgi:hypothetical protein